MKVHKGTFKWKLVSGCRSILAEEDDPPQSRKSNLQLEPRGLKPLKDKSSPRTLHTPEIQMMPCTDLQHASNCQFAALMHCLMYGVQPTKLHAATSPTTNRQPSSCINGILRIDYRTEKSRLRSTESLAWVLASSASLMLCISVSKYVLLTLYSAEVTIFFIEALYTHKMYAFISCIQVVYNLCTVHLHLPHGSNLQPSTSLIVWAHRYVHT